MRMCRKLRRSGSLEISDISRENVPDCRDVHVFEEEIILKRMKTKDLVLCAMFVALIAVGAFIKVPVPVVPFTLQFLFTMLAGLLLGPGNGALAVVIYIVLGLAGLPIFTQGGGPGYIFQPSFGYIIGFAAAGFFGPTIMKNVFPATDGFWQQISSAFLSSMRSAWSTIM